MNINRTVTIIQELCNQNDISIDKMLKECDLKPSVVDNMKKGSAPSVDKIVPIAEYFKVSTDYLLGLDDEPNRKETKQQFQVTGIEKRLLEAFKNLSQNDKLIEIGRIELMAEQARNNVGTSDAAFAAKDNFMKVSAEKPTDTE